MAIEVGEINPLGIVVRDVDGNPINAETVTLSITRPDRTPFAPQVANPPGETGHYLYDLTVTMPGPWQYVWRTTAPTLVLSGSFDAISAGAFGIINLEKAKKLLKIALDDHDHDDDILDVIRAATGAIENERGGQKVLRTEVSQTRWLRGGTTRFSLIHRPVLELVSVTVLDTGLVLEPPDVTVDEHGIVTVHAGSVAGRVRIDYVAGYDIVPEPIREAAGHIVQHLWANRLGSSGRPRAGGQAADGESSMGYSIPNRARDLLGHAGPLVG